MAVLNGFAGSVAGSSGSTNSLEGKSGWFVYVLPRGAYASAASTGTLITFDGTDESGRYATNDWIQVGTDTDGIRRVTGAAGGSIGVNTAVTVSANDRIFVIGTTQPTVTGGSASYQPNTTIYPRDNDSATPTSNSKLTTDSSGNYQFYAADALYDFLVQDANQSLQGALINVPVGLATSGNLVPDQVNTRDLGTAGVPWNDLHFGGSLISGVSNGSGTTMFDFRNATGLTQGNLFEFSLNDSTKVYGDTYGGIQDSYTQPVVVNVKSARFGAKGDNSTDDTTAIANGITFAKTLANGSQGAQVYFPKGVFVVTSPLVFPEGVEPVGEGSRATTLKMDSTFAGGNTELIRIGDGTDGDIHSVLIRDMTLDCNQVAGSIGVYSTECNEEAGVKNCVIINYESAGVFFDGASNQNTRVLNSSFAHTNTAATGISYNTCSSKNIIMDVTLTSNNSTQSTKPAIGITATQVKIYGAHIENHDTGILYGANSSGSVIGAEGHSSVNCLLQIDQEGVLAVDCAPSGATFLICDTATGQTLSTAGGANSGGWYMSSLAQAVGGTRSIWTSDTEATNQVNPNTVFGGTVSFAAPVHIASSIDSQAFESVAQATSITISKNRVVLTGATSPITTINPTDSAYEGMEVFFINEGTSVTFNHLSGGGNIDNDQNLNVVFATGARGRYILRGTTWFQAGARILPA